MKRPSARLGRRVTKYVLWALLIGALFIPYPYKVGGPLEVKPSAYQEVHSEAAGVVEAIHVREGQGVQAGQSIAEVADYAQLKDREATIAAIAEAQARLDELLSTPRAEEVALAERQVEVAETRASFTREEAQRLETLYQSGDVSRDDYEDALRAAEVDRALLLEAQSKLAVVESGPHPKTVEAARAELERLEAQRVFHEEALRRTVIRAAVSGRVVTKDVEARLGSFVNRGELFAEIERANVVHLQLEVPESDIGVLETGGKVLFKVWAYPNRLFEAEVVQISERVVSEDFRRFGFVTARFDNSDGVLKTGMTGFGKIPVGNRPLVVAFTGMFFSFFAIEVWSWIP